MATLSTVALLALLVHSGGPEWHADLDEAFARAADTGRPLLIVFR